MNLRTMTVASCAMILMGIVLIGCNQAESTSSDNNAEQSSNTSASSQPVNEICPIMGGEVASDGGSVEWNGKLVGFCCPECQPQWDRLSDQLKAEKLSAAEANAAHDAAHGDHNHS